MMGATRLKVLQASRVNWYIIIIKKLSAIGLAKMLCSKNFLQEFQRIFVIASLLSTKQKKKGLWDRERVIFVDYCRCTLCISIALQKIVFPSRQRSGSSLCESDGIRIQWTYPRLSRFNPHGLISFSSMTKWLSVNIFHY